MRKITSVLLVLMILISNLSVKATEIDAESIDIFNVRVADDLKSITISGESDNEKEVSILILNEKKSVSSVKNIITNDDYIDIIKYSTILPVDKDGNFNRTIKIDLTGNKAYNVIFSTKTKYYTCSLSALGLNKPVEQVTVTNFRYNNNCVAVEGLAEGEVILTVLKQGKTVEEYIAGEVTTVFSQQTVLPNEYGEFICFFEELPYTDTEDCVLIVENGGTYTLKKPMIMMVSKNGEGDFLTISEAKEYVKTIDRPVEIEIEGGEYIVTEKILFNQEDSRKLESPVVFKSKENQNVVLKGSKKIDTISFEVVDTTDNLYEQINDAMKGKVLKLDLKQQGIPESVYKKATNYFSRREGSDFKRMYYPMGIFLNNRRQNISRYPNNGYLSVANFSNDPPTIVVANSIANRIDKWKAATDRHMMVEGFLTNMWLKEAVGVKEITDNNIVFKHNPYNNSLGAQGTIKWRAINLIEEIDSPGEWYVDEENGVLYWYPGKLLDENDIVEIAVLEDDFINIENASHITIEGLEICKSNSQSHANSVRNGSGIEVDKSKYITVKDCIIHDVGYYGIFVKDRTEGIKIDGCVVYNTGDQAINLSSFGKDVTDNNYAVANLCYSHSIASNCIVSQSGLFTSGNAAALTIAGVGTRAENNSVHNTESNGIQWNTTEGVVSKNEVYKVTTLRSDTAALYAGRTWKNYGSLIENNLIHDFGTKTKAEARLSGIYLDDALGGTVIKGNIIIPNNSNVHNGIYLSQGPDNTIEENIFIGSNSPILYYYRPPSEFPMRAQEVFSLGYLSRYLGKYSLLAERVKLFEENGAFLEGADVETITRNVYDENNIIRNNIAYGTSTFIENMEPYEEHKWNEAPGKYVKKQGSWFSYEVRQENTEENNKILYNSDVFVKGDPLDYRVLSSAKNSNSISENVLDESFDLDDVGIQNNIAKTKIDKNFELIYPANNGSLLDNKEITIAWQESPLADGYKYIVSDKSDFTNVVLQGETYDTSVNIGALTQGDYYWTVIALDYSRKAQQDEIVTPCVQNYEFKVYGTNAYQFNGQPELMIDEEIVTDLSVLQGQTVYIRDRAEVASGAENINVSYILAIYSADGQMSKIYIRNTTVGKDSILNGIVKTTDILLPEKISSDSRYKVFRWNNLVDIKPIINFYVTD